MQRVKSPTNDATCINTASSKANLNAQTNVDRPRSGSATTSPFGPRTRREGFMDDQHLDLDDDDDHGNDGCIRELGTPIASFTWHRLFSSLESRLTCTSFHVNSWKEVIVSDSFGDFSVLDKETWTSRKTSCSRVEERDGEEKQPCVVAISPLTFEKVNLATNTSSVETSIVVSVTSSGGIILLSSPSSTTSDTTPTLSSRLSYVNPGERLHIKDAGVVNVYKVLKRGRTSMSTVDRATSRKGKDCVEKEAGEKIMERKTREQIDDTDNFFEGFESIASSKRASAAKFKRKQEEEAVVSPPSPGSEVQMRAKENSLNLNAKGFRNYLRRAEVGPLLDCWDVVDRDVCSIRFQTQGSVLHSFDSTATGVAAILTEIICIFL